MAAGDFGEKGIFHVCAAPPFAGSVDLRVREQQYAASLPIERTVAGSITARAAGFGYPAGRNPGMDPVVVFPGDLGCCGTGSR
jgi:hypothetical protein